MAVLPTPEPGKVLYWKADSTLGSIKVADLFDAIARATQPDPVVQKYFLDTAELGVSIVAVAGAGALSGLGVTTPVTGSASLAAAIGTGSIGAVSASTGVSVTTSLAAVAGAGTLGAITAEPAAALVRTDNFGALTGYPVYSTTASYTAGTIVHLSNTLYRCHSPGAVGTSPSSATGGSRWRGYMGTNWSPVILPSEATIAACGCGVDQATGRVGSQVTLRTAYWSADSFNAAHYSQITVTNWYTAITRAACAAVRVQPSADTCYYALGTTSLIRIYKYVGGTMSGGTYLATVNRTNSSNDVLKLTATGTGATVTLTAYVNGVSVLTANDSAADRILTGAPGIRIIGAAQTNYQADNWEGGNI